MAKESNNGRIVLAYIEGDQATLQQALHQFGAVVSRRLNPQPKMPIAAENLKALSSRTGHVGAEELDEDAAIELTEEISTVENGGKPKKKRIPKTPALLQDFDPDAGTIPFKDFVAQKNPTTNVQKYLVVAGWFKDRGVDETGPSHIFTCFPLAGWVPPDDMAQTFRDIAKRNHYFERGSARNQWKISIIGINELAKMPSTPN